MDRKIRRHNKPVIKILALMLGMFNGVVLNADEGSLTAEEFLQRPVERQPGSWHLLKNEEKMRVLRRWPAEEHVEFWLMLPQKDKDTNFDIVPEREWLGHWPQLSRFGKAHNFPLMIQRFPDQKWYLFKGLNLKGKLENCSRFSEEELIGFWVKENQKQRDIDFPIIPESQREKLVPLLSQSGQKRHFSIIPSNARTVLFTELSTEEQFKALSDAPAEDRIHFWSNLSEEEFVCYWGGLDQDNKEEYFRFIPEHLRVQCYSDLSDIRRNNNFRYLPEKERTLERWRTLFDPGMNFPHLPEKFHLEAYPLLEEDDKADWFYLLSPQLQIHFWLTLSQKIKDLCYPFLVIALRAARFNDLSQQGQAKWAHLRPANPVNVNIGPMFWKPIQFNDPKNEVSSSHE